MTTANGIDAAMRFRNRTEAGQMLAKKLASYAHRAEVLVLALPRGGVPVGFEVARALHAPLDVFAVRKLGVPGREELAMGAIASGGVRVLNGSVIEEFQISEDLLGAVVSGELHELERRERIYRGNRSVPEVRDRTVILVDDGIATGSTMRAAVAALRQRGANHLVVATPVAALSTAQQQALGADEFVTVMSPADFASVGQWYDDFSQTTDAEVRALLARAQHGVSNDESHQT